VAAALTAAMAARLLGKALKAITGLILLAIFLVTTLTIIVHNDIEQVKEDINEKTTLFVLADELEVLAAVGIKPVLEGKLDFTSFTYYEEEELKVIKEYVNNNTVPFEGVGRAFIIKPALLNKTYALDFGKPLKHDDLLELIMNDSPYELLSSKLKPELDYPSDSLRRAYGHDGVIKGYALAALTINYLNTTGKSLSQAIKRGDLRVVPDAQSFKLLRLMLPNWK
jgi:hypothetical protein